MHAYMYMSMLMLYIYDIHVFIMWWFAPGSIVVDSVYIPVSVYKPPFVGLVQSLKPYDPRPNSGAFVVNLIFCGFTIFGDQN